jgi:hypothetical protein
MWNSLEIAKLIVSVLTPLAVALLSFAVTRAGKRAEDAAADAARRAESSEWANRRAIERLIELHKEMAPLLNDLMCFFRLIGHFREIDPPAALARKRQLDRTFYANEHLFGRAFRDSYLAFMERCFAHWQSPGQDAKMKASATRLRDERGAAAYWNDDWNVLFDDVSHSSDLRRNQKAAYDVVMAAFAAELGLDRAGEAAGLDVESRS